MKLTDKHRVFVRNIEMACWHGTITPNKATLHAIFHSYASSLYSNPRVNVLPLTIELQDYFTEWQGVRIERRAAEKKAL